MRLVFMGTPDFAVSALELLLLNGYDVAAVYTQPDRPAGRGRSLLSSPVKEMAEAWHLPVVQPETMKSPEAVARLREFQPDIIVVAAYGQLLPQAVLDIPPCGCVNLHPSLLPRFRGASPVAAAILAGDEFTGVSIMLLDAGVDTGPVFARAQVPVSPRDTTGSLTGKLALVAARLLQEVLVRWLRREIVPQSQDDAAASYSGAIDKKDSEIDWSLPAETIWRQVRAYQPWPGAFTRWRGQQLKILEAVPLSREQGATVGQVIALPGGSAAFGVRTGAGLLGILKLQLEGKRAVTAADFLRGQREFAGSVLPS